MNEANMSLALAQVDEGVTLTELRAVPTCVSPFSKHYLRGA